MDIPLQFRSKMGVYDIQLDGIKVKVNLLDPNFMLETAISEFKSAIETNLPVVGVDFKPSKYTSPALLLLYTKDRCLIIQLSQVRVFPATLGLFLSDKSICFVGFKIDEHFSKINVTYRYETSLTGKGAEIRSLAAAVLQNPSLAKCVDVFELVNKAELIEMKQPVQANMPSDWSAKFFTKEEINYAIHDAYNYHKIGKKLLGML